MRGTRRFKVKGKLATRYVGPFKIVDHKGEVTYQLERGNELILGYRPSLIGSLSPLLLSPSPVLQLVSEPVWSPIGFNRLCDLKATWRNVLLRLWSSMAWISVTGKTKLATIS
jgi:hypothetical protein